ncbi:MAG TPA: uracil-DNA glycosylase [Candidatus Sulfotelmatobacter sp.]|nr:uracil-DNA glycosylase [Candidatus Sulfotelmatobacter sp.]
MPRTLDPDLRRALAERVRYCHEMGIYDFYRRDPQAAAVAAELDQDQTSQDLREEMPPKKSTVLAPVVVKNVPQVPHAEQSVTDPSSALKLIREDLGDCTRCKLHQQGRKQIVFGVGNPHADLMFVGEGPGADEDTQGEPFVGRAGQLLNNMIKAMGIRREDVYIANIVKCRPPGNRTPERDECETCSPFLMRQIAVIKPKIVVALGAVAAKNLLAINAPMSELRGRFYDFTPSGARSSDPLWQGAKLAVTYHPAFLLRDPRQKGEAWKDLQMVMKYLGLEPPKKPVE